MNGVLMFYHHMSFLIGWGIVRVLMKRKRKSDFSSMEKPPASIQRVNPNEYQLICIGDLVKSIYKT